MRTIFLMLAAHYLADLALQGDFVATYKVQYLGKERKFNPIWYHVLLGHCMFHALGIYLSTGSLLLAVAELGAHFVIDYIKGREWIGFNLDQALHIACELIWYILLTWCL